MELRKSDLPPSSTVFTERVSWRVLLVGALATLSVLTVLWLLGSGITGLAIDASQLRGASIALVLIAIGVTLIGGALGGLVAGFTLGNRNRFLGGFHGVAGCALAFLITTGLSMSMFGNSLRAANLLSIQTAPVAPSSWRSGDAAEVDRGSRAIAYRPAAPRLVADAQSAREEDPAAAAPPTMTNPNTIHAVNTGIKMFGGTLLGYVMTWIVAMVLSFLFGGMGARLELVEPTRRERIIAEPSPVAPATPYPPTQPLRPHEV